MDKYNVDWCPSINLGHIWIPCKLLMTGQKGLYYDKEGWSKPWPVLQVLKALVKILLLNSILTQDVLIKKHKQMRCYMKAEQFRPIVLSFVALVSRQIKVIF